MSTLNVGRGKIIDDRSYWMAIAAMTRYVVVEMKKVRITKQRMIEAGCILLVLRLLKNVDSEGAKQDFRKERTE